MSFFKNYRRIKSRIDEKVDADLNSAKQEELYELPVDFDPEVYIAFNPDLEKAGCDPVSHFLNHGRHEGRVYSIPHIDVISDLNPAKQTLLLVSHEASRTGAPILSLNLAWDLGEKYNVFVLLLGGGVLYDDFLKSGAFAVQVINQRLIPPPSLKLLINKICKKYDLDFAIVNSIESSAVIEPLSKNNVPVVTLAHEFASYTRPHDVFRRAFYWSNQIVFSANLVKENALLTYPDINSKLASITTHPQGKCLIPRSYEEKSSIDEKARLAALIRPSNLEFEPFIVLGAGHVHYRKGVDLFIECATRVLQFNEGRNCRFLWVGDGFDPEGDVAYSAYLKDQIQRSNLNENFNFISSTAEIESVYEKADLFLLSSRLDPLPNVAIDAMISGVPVLCFDGTTGIVDFYKEAQLYQSLVSPYIDTASMAKRVLDLKSNKIYYQAVSEKSKKLAAEYFDMHQYVLKLEGLCVLARMQIQQEVLDTKSIIDSGLFVKEYGSPREFHEKSLEDCVRLYVRSWANGLGRRRPFPGFHPGIYLEQHGVKVKGADPFADYIRSGFPDGPWLNALVDNNHALGDLDSVRNQDVAMHIHVYYPDLFPELLDALAFNNVQPDLFISLPNKDAFDLVVEQLKGYKGRVIDIHVVCNLGRDIGPFLTEFGKRICQEYKYVGHFHTKKSLDKNNPDLGPSWFRFLKGNLLGSESQNMADIILATLKQNDSIGIVFPDDPHVIGWEKNIEHASILRNKLDIHSEPEYFLFPIGTMFWAKTSAIQNLIDLELQWSDFPMEPLQMDGTILHAIERLFGFPSAGLGIATTYIKNISR